MAHHRQIKIFLLESTNEWPSSLTVWRAISKSEIQENNHFIRLKVSVYFLASFCFQELIS